MAWSIIFCHTYPDANTDANTYPDANTDANTNINAITNAIADSDTIAVWHSDNFCSEFRGYVFYAQY
jgi:hypothetical protein